MLIEFNVIGQDIELIGPVRINNSLVSGSKQEYVCQFNFDASWEGYTKTAVFMIENPDKCEGESLELALLEDDTCVIPVQILKPCTRLSIGIYGIQGDKIKPTVYSTPLLVRLGATPTNAAIDPDPNFFDQVLIIMEETKAIAQSVRNDADAGKFDGVGVPTGGLKGQILEKKSNADYDFEWADSGDVFIGVTAWNGRKGAVLPEANDYSYDQIQGLQEQLRQAKIGETFVFKQRAPSDNWIVNHNLNKYPSVTIIDSGGSAIIGETIYQDSNNLSIHFTNSFSGTAYLN